MLRENTRILTDVQDVTSDESIPFTSTPKKNPRTDVTHMGTGGGTYSSPAHSSSTYNSPAYSRSTYNSPAYSGQTPMASRSMPLTATSTTQTKPKKTLAATFCRYPSDDDKRMDLV